MLSAFQTALVHHEYIGAQNGESHKSGDEDDSDQGTAQIALMGVAAAAARGQSRIHRRQGRGCSARHSARRRRGYRRRHPGGDGGRNAGGHAGRNCAGRWAGGTRLGDGHGKGGAEIAVIHGDLLAADGVELCRCAGEAGIDQLRVLTAADLLEDETGDIQALPAHIGGARRHGVDDQTGGIFRLLHSHGEGAGLVAEDDEDLLRAGNVERGRATGEKLTPDVTVPDDGVVIGAVVCKKLIDKRKAEKTVEVNPVEMVEETPVMEEEVPAPAPKTKAKK